MILSVTREPIAVVVRLNPEDVGLIDVVRLAVRDVAANRAVVAVVDAPQGPVACGVVRVGDRTRRRAWCRSPRDQCPGRRADHRGATPVGVRLTCRRPC